MHKPNKFDQQALEELNYLFADHRCIAILTKLGIAFENLLKGAMLRYFDSNNRSHIEWSVTIKGENVEGKVAKDSLEYAETNSLLNCFRSEDIFSKEQIYQFVQLQKLRNKAVHRSIEVTNETIDEAIEKFVSFTLVLEQKFSVNFGIDWRSINRNWDKSKSSIPSVNSSTESSTSPSYTPKPQKKELTQRRVKPKQSQINKPQNVTPATASRSKTTQPQDAPKLSVVGQFYGLEGYEGYWKEQRISPKREKLNIVLKDNKRFDDDLDKTYSEYVRAEGSFRTWLLGNPFHRELMRKTVDAPPNIYLIWGGFQGRITGEAYLKRIKNLLSIPTDQFFLFGHTEHVAVAKMNEPLRTGDEATLSVSKRYNTILTYVPQGVEILNLKGQSLRIMSSDVYKLMENRPELIREFCSNDDPNDLSYPVWLRSLGVHYRFKFKFEKC